MKILFVQLGRIGDMILATPMFRAIKEKYPEAEIHVAAGRHNFSIIENNPHISRIMVLEKTPLKLAGFIIKLKRSKYDYLIDPKDHRSSESRLIARIVRARKKIGFNLPGDKVYDIGIDGEDRNAGIHYVMKCLKSLIPLGIPLPERVPRPQLFESRESSTYTENFLATLPDKPLVVINLSASRYDKMWDDINWITLIRKLPADKINIVITSAPSERVSADNIASESKVAVRFPGRSMNDVTSLVSRAKLMITPDTSLVHVAAAFDIPLVGMFSGLDDFVSRFYPLSSNYRTVRSPRGVDGIRGIEPERVIAAVNEMIGLEIFEAK